MSKKILSIFVCLIFSIFIVGCGNKEKTKETLYNRNDLEIISEHGGYIIALTESGVMQDTYSMYENVEHYYYKKIWDFSIHANDGIGRGKQNIIWDNKNVYIFGYSNVNVYDIETGDETYNLSSYLTPVEENATGYLGTIFGHDDNFIYYKYSSNTSHKTFYGKVKMDLSDVEVITEEEIPSNLKK